jgi:hypothetical protein
VNPVSIATLADGDSCKEQTQKSLVCIYFETCQKIIRLIPMFCQLTVDPLQTLFANPVSIATVADGDSCKEQTQRFLVCIYFETCQKIIRLIPMFCQLTVNPLQTLFANPVSIATVADGDSCKEQTQKSLVYIYFETCQKLSRLLPMFCVFF